MLKSERLLQVKSATDFLRSFHIYKVCDREIIHVDAPTAVELYMREVSIHLSFAGPVFTLCQQQELLTDPELSIVFGRLEQEDHVRDQLSKLPHVGPFIFIPQRPNRVIH